MNYLKFVSFSLIQILFKRIILARNNIIVKLYYLLINFLHLITKAIEII